VSYGRRESKSLIRNLKHSFVINPTIITSGDVCPFCFPCLFCQKTTDLFVGLFVHLEEIRCLPEARAKDLPEAWPRNHGPNKTPRALFPSPFALSTHFATCSAHHLFSPCCTKKCPFHRECVRGLLPSFPGNFDDVCHCVLLPSQTGPSLRDNHFSSDDTSRPMVCLRSDNHSRALANRNRQRCISKQDGRWGVLKDAWPRN